MQKIQIVDSCVCALFLVHLWLFFNDIVHVINSQISPTNSGIRALGVLLEYCGEIRACVDICCCLSCDGFYYHFFSTPIS